MKTEINGVEVELTAGQVAQVLAGRGYELVYPDIGTSVGFLIAPWGEIEEASSSMPNSPYYSQGNAAETQEEAERMVRWRALNTRVLQCIKVENAKDDWVGDWDDHTQDKCLISFEHAAKYLYLHKYRNGQTHEYGNYVSETTGRVLLKFNKFTKSELAFWVTRQEGLA